MIKAYKYRLNPTVGQKDFFERSFGCARFVYNWALERRVKAYQADKTRLSFFDLSKDIVSLKKEEDKSWLNDVYAQSLLCSIRNMDSAFTRFFREKKGFPKFKSKHGSRQAFQYIQGIKIDFDSHKVYLPKAGWVKFFKSREFEGKIGTTTVSKTATGKYFVSILVDDGKGKPAKAPITEETAVGIDVGINSFAVLSDGTVIDNPKYLEKAESRLKVLQRRLAKKQKGSKRRERARKAVARQYETVRNKRTDFMHQVTTRIVRENQTIIIEDLNVDGMLQNHCLAKHISSASWNEFFRQLEYKCDWYGKNLIRIGRFEPSSRMCECGHIYKELTLKDRTWVCHACGRENDRDLLAARNIKRFGLQKQNLIGISPGGTGEVRVERSTLVWAVKRECLQDESE